MTRTMLRGIRVASKQEPIDRIHRYFEEISADPVVFRWKYKMDETLKTWRRYCLRHNRLLTRAAPYGADSEPRTSESGCAITCLTRARGGQETAQPGLRRSATSYQVPASLPGRCVQKARPPRRSTRRLDRGNSPCLH